MRKACILSVSLLVIGFILAGCATTSGPVPWENPATDEDSAILCRIKADSNCTSGSSLQKVVVVFTKKGSPETINYTVDLAEQGKYPQDPLLLKVTPGEWAVAQADYYVSPGPYFETVCTSPKFSQCQWVEIGKGEVGVGNEIGFNIDFKVEGERWNSQNSVKITYGYESRLAMVDDALFWAKEGTPWHTRLAAAKEKLLKEKEIEDKKLEEEKKKQAEEKSPK